MAPCCADRGNLMLSRIATSLLFVPSIAVAQTQTTDCTRDYFGNLHCTTQTNGGINWGLLNQQPTQPQPNAGQSFMNGWEQGQRMRAQIEAQRAARAQQQAAEEAQTIAEAEQRGRALAEQQRQTASQMIATGNCNGAEQYALSVSNLDLAKQVKDYCAK